MTKKPKYLYDVFISYSHVDKAWVLNELLPRLEERGIKVCIDDRDFEIGTPSLVNMEKAVEKSRHTLIVLTPDWVKSEWTEFESLLIAASDPAGRRRKLIPLLLKPTALPSRIGMLTYVDFQNINNRNWKHLISSLAAQQDKQPVSSGAAEGSVHAAVHDNPGLPTQESFRREHLIKLREQLASYFNVGELRGLCFDLGFDYDNLPGDGKAEKAREIVQYMQRNVRMQELIAYCSRERPNVSWRDMP